MKENLTKVITIDGKHWRIHKGQSIFTNRNGKKDISIMKECKTHGAMYDGVRYDTQKRLQAEDYQVIRDYGVVPIAIMDNLVSWGF